MKNNVFRSLAIFIVMSLFNAQLSECTLHLFKERSGEMAMISIGVMAKCLIVTFISFITVVLFRKNYDSVLKMAILFEIVYLIILMISGMNPFKYFSNRGEAEFFALFLYINSFIVFSVLFLIDLLYSKINSSKIKN